MAVDMEKLASFCRDTGFIYPSSSIYGGINGFWDYGPLGVELKKNIKDAWWLDMVRNPPPGPDGKEIRMVGLDCAIIMNPKVWVASGHVGGFSDPMVDCLKCKRRFRADKVYRQGYLRRGTDGSLVQAPELGYLTAEASDIAEARTELHNRFVKQKRKQKLGDEITNGPVASLNDAS